MDRYDVRDLLCAAAFWSGSCMPRGHRHRHARQHPQSLLAAVSFLCKRTDTAAATCYFGAVLWMRANAGRGEVWGRCRQMSKQWLRQGKRDPGATDIVCEENASVMILTVVGGHGCLLLWFDWHPADYGRGESAVGPCQTSKTFEEIWARDRGLQWKVLNSKHGMESWPSRMKKEWNPANDVFSIHFRFLGSHPLTKSGNGHVHKPKVCIALKKLWNSQARLQCYRMGHQYTEKEMQV